MAYPAAAVGPKNALNDTGITTYGDATGNSLTAEPADYIGQDARRGRDAAAAAGQLPKTGAGSKGFDFTKISNGGAVLPASASLGQGPSDWGCTYDNVTGLMWEVKVKDASHLRHIGWVYAWYNSDSATNGGSAGAAGGGEFNSNSCRTTGRCDTEKFVQDVNAAGLCGHSDWRMPSKKELHSIVDYGRYTPAIDSSWFPNTPASAFWSASANADRSGYAWLVSFNGGGDSYVPKAYGTWVRLVRAGQ